MWETRSIILTEGLTLCMYVALWSLCWSPLPMMLIFSQNVPLWVHFSSISGLDLSINNRSALSIKNLQVLYLSRLVSLSSLQFRLVLLCSRNCHYQQSLLQFICPIPTPERCLPIDIYYSKLIQQKCCDFYCTLLKSERQKKYTQLSQRMRKV